MRTLTHTLAASSPHSPFFLGLIVTQANKRQGNTSMSASALMGALTGLQAAEIDDDDNGINDVFDALIEEEEEKRKAVIVACIERTMPWRSARQPSSVDLTLLLARCG